MGVSWVQGPYCKFGTPHASGTIRSGKLKFYIHLDRMKCSFRDDNFSAGGAGARGQVADREASSCNAAQLPRFLVRDI